MKTYEELQAENTALVAECDALAARIQAAERVEKIFSETPEPAFDDCLKLFADEIREIKAKAGRAGFIAGTECCADYLDTYYADIDFSKHADQYAEKVRNGK